MAAGGRGLAACRIQWAIQNYEPTVSAVFFVISMRSLSVLSKQLPWHTLSPLVPSHRTHVCVVCGCQKAKVAADQNCLRNADKYGKTHEMQ